jgi:hypothetical protein
LDAELGAPTPRLVREAVLAGRADDVGVERALGKGRDLVPVGALLGRQLKVDAITPFLDRGLISRNLEEGALTLSRCGQARFSPSRRPGLPA